MIYFITAPTTLIDNYILKDRPITLIYMLIDKKN